MTAKLQNNVQDGDTAIRSRPERKGTLTFHTFLQHGQTVGDLSFQLVDLERSEKEEKFHITAFKSKN